ncbi:hypothetical protein [Salinisphaera aquimarina]|uniref:Antitoxin ParD n=1 Tax=Salinisphaera aquimarina TaxID=2094031 RepID=A0ABV7ERH1_9GAMM
MRRLSIELPESLHQQIKAQASIEGLSMRAYVLQRLGVSSDRQTQAPPVIADYARGSMRELIHSREWRGTRTPAEIDAQIAEERASWSGTDSTG